MRYIIAKVQPAGLFLLFTSLFMLIGTLAPVGSASAAGFTVVGSWEIKDDNSPAMFLATFNRDQTYTIAASSREVSESHGVWRNSSANTVDTTDLAFIYDPTTGAASLIQKIQAKVTLSADRQSLHGILVITIMQLDGTVAQTINTTATGTRITVEPLP